MRPPGVRSLPHRVSARVAHRPLAGPGLTSHRRRLESGHDQALGRAGMTTRAPLVPGRVSPWREVPVSIPRPEYVGKKEPTRSNRTVQTPEIIDRMRVAGRLAAQAVVLAGEHSKTG